jgi:hypothetical protein
MPDPSPEQQPSPQPWFDPRVFASTPLGRLGASPRREDDPAAVGPYSVAAVLGRGGMGRIYLGRPSSGAPGLATVKVIRPEYADDPQFRRRFQREATALERVRGEHTAVFLGADFDGKLLWMAAEYIPGLSLSDAVSAAGRLGAEAAWRLLGDLGSAVGAMERVGVVHRDLKPANTVLGPDGARLIDFGIAYAAETSTITVTGQQVGTPAYMSPEQVRGQSVSSAADVFSLGSVLAYAVAGSAPFGAGTAVDVLHRVAFEPPKEEVLEQVAAVDRGLAALVERCLEKDAGRRPTPEELIAEANLRRVSTPWSAELSSMILDRCRAASEAERLPLPESTGTLRIGPAPAGSGEPGAGAAAFGAAAFGPPAFGPPAFGPPAFGPPAYGPPASSDTGTSAADGTGRTPTAPTEPGAGPGPGPQGLAAAGGAGSADGADVSPGGPGRSGGSGASGGPGGERPGRRRWPAVLAAAGVVVVAAAVSAVVVLLLNHGSGQQASDVGTASTAPTAGTNTTGAASPSAADPSPSAAGSATAGSAPTSAGAGAPPSGPATSAPAARPTTRAAAPPPASHSPTSKPVWDRKCTYYSGTALTEQGDTGPRVKEVQCILVHRGYSVGSSGVDGQFGPDTTTAVKKFQTAQRIGVDGQVGPETWRYLRAS